jgi:hypothetical protein
MTISDFHHPTHWHLLSSNDAQEYIRLANQFHATPGKSRKGARIESFSHSLNKIRRFIESDDEDHWKRSLACGIFFLPDCLALNIQQLCILIGKCKSSINGSLQQMGYTAQPQSPGLETSFLAQLPGQYREMNELKNWTIRRKPQSGGPFVVPVPTNLSATNTVVEKPIDGQINPRMPCPVKWRYKFMDAMKSMESNQSGKSDI